MHSWQAMAELYASEDAQQILQIAIAKETESGELTRSQLLEIASELGVSAETLVSAEQEWLRLKNVADEQAQFNQYQQQRFQHHFVRYAIVNSFLLLLDFLAGGGVGWSLYISLCWGMALVLHAWQAYQTSGYRHQVAFEKWQRQRRVKQSVNKLVSRLLGTQS